MSDMDKYQRQAVEDGNNLRRLKAQRDQLRKALRHIAYSNACDHDDMQCVQAARAALKATEEDV